MITIEQYYGKKLCDPQVTKTIMANSIDLLARVNALLTEYEEKTGQKVKIDKDTGTQISGSKGGSGDGGFRLANSKTGAARSAHKEGKAVDVYDPDNKLDDWITDKRLEKLELYREHPDHTKGWCHLSNRSPRSGTRSYHI